MPSQRVDGQEHPGLRWGPFTFRIPFVHTGVAWPELAQGVFVAGATGLGLVPVLTAYFGLSFEEAVCCIFIQAVLISSAPILFGEPYAPGWITPALPLALAFVLSDAYPTPVEKFQIMTAISIDFAILVFFLGITGLGRVFFTYIPAALKGGIILGAAIAALKRVFVDDAEEYLHVQPITTLVAVGVCMILTFSEPVQRLRGKYPWLGLLAGMGLLPGFLIAAIVGPMVGEIDYQIKGETFFLIPPFIDLWEKVSPFAIGWPTAEMFFQGAFIALAGYVILFGDLITGAEVNREAMGDRPDEHLDMNINRSHYSIAIRNALMALFAPFFPTQGCLWTGVHVIVVQRWKQGRASMESLYTGISSYYVFGVPVLYLVLPLLYLLQPLMGIALSLTLVLTGFACAYVAMAITQTNIERGVALLTAVTIAFFAAQPWIGIVVGVLSTLLLVGFKLEPSLPAENAGEPDPVSAE